MSKIVSLGSAIAAKKALENIVDDLYFYSKGNIKRKIGKWKTTKKIDTLYKNIRSIRKVKTIIQLEKEVDLTKFYYPSKVKSGNELLIINEIDDFPYKGNIVLRGIIGQGKSIFFRYLTCRELTKGVAIPLFIELRKLKKELSLIDNILREIDTYGLNVDEELFDFLSSQGKLIIFFDAFDEVADDIRQDVIVDIENLCKKYEKLRIFVSTRPNSGIETSPFFRVFDLSHLIGDEYEAVISKMSHNDEIASKLCKSVEKTGVASLLNTPLMVALLLFRFRIDQTIPENTKAFYDELFMLMIRRHDKSKGGFMRPRKSEMSDFEMLSSFNAVSFYTRTEKTGVFTSKEFVDYSKKALDMLSLDKRKAEDFCMDVIDNTCLILEEGGECRYIHKSVQEFHAACFVRELPEQSGQTFYMKMLTEWRKWEQELYFLSLIDEYRYVKYFEIPDIVEVTKKLNINIGAENVVDLKIVQDFVSDKRVTFEETSRKPNSVTTSHVNSKHYSYYKLLNRVFVDYLFSISFTKPAKESGVGRWIEETDWIELEIDMILLYNLGDNKRKINKAFIKAVNALVKNLQDSEKFIKKREDQKMLKF